MNKYTVIGFFRDDGEMWRHHVKAENPAHAARCALEADRFYDYYADDADPRSHYSNMVVTTVLKGFKEPEWVHEAVRGDVVMSRRGEWWGMRDCFYLSEEEEEFEAYRKECFLPWTPEDMQEALLWFESEEKERAKQYDAYNTWYEDNEGGAAACPHKMFLLL